VPQADHPTHRRLLDAASRKGVDIEIVTFSESTHTAEEAARAVGAQVGQIVKSLVFVGRGEAGTPAPALALVSGANRVDVGRLGAVLGEPELRRASAREVQELTGFSIGGVPPIGHERPVRVVMDRDLGRFPTVWAAAGTSTSVFAVSPATLRSLANATVAPIAEEPQEPRDREQLASGPPATGEDPAARAFEA
jgi:prolyl-tRNA editing enzyme YbaK/EbsC (Cys-tRNA(Pro) deacylase)